MTKLGAVKTIGLMAAAFAAVAAPIAFGMLQAVPKLQFEVASIRPHSKANGLSLSPHRSGKQVFFNTALVSLVEYAYHVQSSYIQGSLPFTMYDIVANMEGTPTEDAIRLMFQSLLENRFQLKVHRETKDVPVFELVAAKNGPRLSVSKDDAKLTIDGRPIPQGQVGTYLGVDGAHLMGKAASLAELIGELGGRLGSPVVDRTGLNGTFDFDVIYVPEDQSSKVFGPSLTTAIDEQLGLKVQRSRGPVEFLVIDHIEKPGEN